MASITALGPAKCWLRQCHSEHESCGKRARLSTIWSSDNMHIIRPLGVVDMMPKRLLRFSKENDSRVHLVEFDKPKEETPYLALSYCWGDSASSMPKTLKENLVTRKTFGLAIQSLPATFQDALSVTRELGYEYLWIDSLCIVQDDADDWKEEAPRMAVVYGNAACTIHASDAPGCDKGLFDVHVSDEERGSLETRAWTMQERAISPRSLSFAAGAIRWECREGHAAGNDETITPNSPGGSSNMTQGTAKRSLKDILVFFRDWRIPGTEGEDPEPTEEARIALSYAIRGEKEDYMPLIHTWWELIPEYTARDLSFESDRFLALNGVAAVAQQRAQIRNTWGLWMDFLETDLLWYIDPAGPEGRPTSKWLAPSWSWAARSKGRVRNGLYERGDKGKKATLQLKPVIGCPVGTSFDQSLPIPAWRSRENHEIQLQGDLRTGEITAFLDRDGRKQYKVVLASVGRWSEEERYDFRPDAPGDFPVGETRRVICLLVFHLSAERCDLDEDVNILLVFRQQRQEQDIKLYGDWVNTIDISEERTMVRLGYLEATFKEARDWNDIYEDLWWKAVWLI